MAPDPAADPRGQALFVPTVAAARTVSDSTTAGVDHWVTYNLCVVAESESRGVSCVDLHGYLEEAEPRDNFERLRLPFLGLLLALDEAEASARKPSPGEPPLTWHFSFYRYLGLLEYAGLVLFDRAVRRYLDERSIRRLQLAGAFTPGLAALADADYRQVLAAACRSRSVDFVVHEPTGEQGTVARRRSATGRQVRALAGSVRQLVRRRRMTRGRTRRPGTGSTLLIEPFYEAAYLPAASARVCVWPMGGVASRSRPARPAPARRSGAPRPVLTGPFSELPHVELYVEAMTVHLDAHRSAGQRAVEAARALVARHRVTQAVWGTSPAAAGPDTIVVEWLRRQGIRVFGLQHGGSYGDQPLDALHLLSDYLYCDEFLAYGAQPRDWEPVPPIGLAPAAIVAVGSLKESARRAKRRRSGSTTASRVDILFPVSLAHDLATGVPLAKGDDMWARQRAIIRHLEGLAARVVIKPLRRISHNPEYLERYFPAHADLETLRHCAVDESCTYEEALDHYQPRLVILDWLSTTLQESLGHDVDIVQLVDRVCPPKPAIRQLLDDRIYWADDVAGLLGVVDQLVQGQLGRKRGHAYYDQFVCPSGDAAAAAAERLGWMV